MPVSPEPLFLKDDLLDIESTLYEAPSEELIHRQIFGLNTDFMEEAEEIGYDTIARTGRVKLFAGRANADDIPLVGDKKVRTPLSVHEIAGGLTYTRAERAASAAARGLGRGPAVALDMLRVETLRQYFDQEEGRIVWNGDSSVGIKGLFDDTYWNEAGFGVKDLVTAGATGSSTATKRLWANKSSQEIIADCTRGRGRVGKKGIYAGRTLVIPHAQNLRLEQPYSSTNATTIKDFLLGTNGKRAYFDNILATNALQAGAAADGFNGDTLDYMMILDNRPQAWQIALVKDLELFPPVYNKVQDSEQAAILRTAGMIVRATEAGDIQMGI